MRLSMYSRELAQLGLEDLTAAILERRRDLRAHRDAKGDDRCWLDDYLVWRHVYGSDEAPDGIGDPAKFLARCEDFWRYRREEEPDATHPAAQPDAEKWNDDLFQMSLEGMVYHLAAIQVAIKMHFITSRIRPLTTADDRQLYRVLPEKVAADFRLPERDAFLGTKLSPRAGCPAFADSHKACGVKRHNLHAWGPCQGSAAS